MPVVSIRWNWFDCDTPKEESDDIVLEGVDTVLDEVRRQPPTPLTCYEDTHHTPGSGESILWEQLVMLGVVRPLTIRLVTENAVLGSIDLHVRFLPGGASFATADGSPLGTIRLLDFEREGKWRYVGQFETI